MALSGFNTPISRSRTPISENLFSKRISNIKVAGILSDMDGTLIDSTNAIVKHWERIGQIYGIDPRTILATSHGRRSIDVFQQIDPSKATWEYVRGLEADIPQIFADDAHEIAGARQMLDTFQELNAKWAIVTSGTRPLVAGWLQRLELAEPEYMVTAEDVENGKPDPECYRLGARKLGLENADAESILVLEDAPAGVKAGKAAGYKVLGLATTHRVEDLKTAGADWVIPDLRSLRILKDETSKSGLEVQITNFL